MSPGYEIVPVSSKRDWKNFHAAAGAALRSDPAWVQPLLFERAQHLDPTRNPYFKRAECAFWVAVTWEGRPVGRISAQVDRAHLERHADAAGFFGFLDGINDPDIFAGLMDAAESWLRERGMERVRGPFSLSINDETGLLVDGFDRPPMLMMGHAGRWYDRYLAAAGYTKEKDVVAYLTDVADPLPEAVAGFAEKALSDDAIVVRQLDWRRYDRDLRIVLDIFNDAWSENWGFVPFSEVEMAAAARDMKPILRSDLVAIAEVNGEPAAMSVGLPNLNEAIAGLNGRLFPVGWIKLLWRLKVAGLRSARVPLMGVRRAYHGTPIGSALGLAVIETMRRKHLAAGFRSVELSWVLEDNTALRRLLDLCGAAPYKTYRIYGKAL